MIRINNYIQEKLHIGKDFGQNTKNVFEEVCQIYRKFCEESKYERTRNMLHDWLEKFDVKKVDYIIDFPDKKYLDVDNKAKFIADTAVQLEKELNDSFKHNDPNYDGNTVEDTFVDYNDNLFRITFDDDNTQRSYIMFVRKLQ